MARMSVTVIILNGGERLTVDASYERCVEAMRGNLVFEVVGVRSHPTERVTIAAGSISAVLGDRDRWIQ
jgi:hypothetical protein